MTRFTKTRVGLWCVALSLLVAAGTSGCEGDDPGLLLAIDLKTDFVPGIEFQTVRTVVTGTSLDRSVSLPVSLGDDFITGSRIAELEGLTAGTLLIHVELRTADGTEVVVRPVRVDFDGRLGITVVVTRDCLAVSCPVAGGDASATACLGGRCVDSTCVEERPELCGEPDCTAPTDCAEGSPCTTPVCIAGTCLLAADTSACTSAEYCDPDLGCRTLPTTVDAGPGDGGADAGFACIEAHLGSALGDDVATGTASGDDHVLGLCAFAGVEDASYGWRPPETGLYRFSLVSDGEQVSVGIFDDCSGTSLHGCAIGAAGGNASIPARVTADRDVVIALDARVRLGTYRLSIHQLCPDQDINSDIGPDITTGTTVGGREEFTAETCMTSSGRPAGEGLEMTVRWTAPTAGRFAFDVRAPAFDPHLYVLDGGCGGREVACIVGSGGSARTELMMTAGQTVALVVDGARGDAGSFALTVEAL